MPVYLRGVPSQAPCRWHKQLFKAFFLPQLRDSAVAFPKQIELFKAYCKKPESPQFLPGQVLQDWVGLRWGQEWPQWDSPPNLKSEAAATSTKQRLFIDTQKSGHSGFLGNKPPTYKTFGMDSNTYKMIVRVKWSKAGVEEGKQGGEARCYSCPCQAVTQGH